MSSRVLQPTAVRVLDVREDNYRTRTLVLDCHLDASPGQFVMLWLPRFDEKPYSLVAADPVTVMVTAVGPFSRAVHGLRPGERIWLRGPFGHGFAPSIKMRRVALVGGGYGVAPLSWLATTQAGVAQEMTVIIGARTADDVLYAADLARIDALDTTYATVITTEDGSLGLPGRVTDALQPMLESRKLDGIFACGPHPMLSAIAQLASQYGVPAQLSWEAYMRCGIGICGACEHEGRVLCQEGPVLFQEGPVLIQGV